MNKIFITELTTCGAALIFYIAMLATQKKRREKIRSTAGALILKTASPLKRKTLSLWIVIPLVLAFAFLVNYSALFVILICALCSLAIFISCHDDACNVNNGIYENGIIGGGEFIHYEKIKSVENCANAKNIPENLILQIELVDSKKIQMQFANEKEFKCALEQIEKHI
ncbi:MAG: hypothetical protein K2H67_04090 [Treponemataceae bacterium]|nr:hypothetical protein [Treponemataceae bacterium]